jgi:hypothetical protein
MLIGHFPEAFYSFRQARSVEEAEDLAVLSNYLMVTSRKQCKTRAPMSQQISPSFVA